VKRFGSICLIIPPVLLTILLMLMAGWATYFFSAFVIIVGYLVNIWNNSCKAAETDESTSEASTTLDDDGEVDLVFVGELALENHATVSGEMT
jgi:hypothetical protein